MKYEIKTDGGKTVLQIGDQLVAADRNEFDSLLPRVFVSRPTTIEVDFQGLTFMDSAGLGMLLTLREQAERNGASVALARPQGAVKEMLELACFDTLFPILAR
ncbi:MAG: STAS domain-containing protein [Magnetospirillum sp. WYHS-4]